jgi:nicotinamide-nucleotide amidase
MSSPDAEVLTIGTELLLGEITDTNTAVIARSLRDLGVNLFRTATVGDNAEGIAKALQERFGQVQIIITTGGLGPTVDDPTREAVALALGVPTEFVPELWEQIKTRFAAFGRTPGENNRRQAHLPQGAQPIENPVGTAPAFWAESHGTLIVSLPGVPSEMSYLLEHAVLPLIRSRFDLPEVIRTRIVRTAGVGESTLDEQIGTLEKLSNPTVGVSAHPGRVDIRITSRASSAEAAEALIEPVASRVQWLLGPAVYGFDDQTLEGAVLAAAAARGWRVASVEAGSGGALVSGLSRTGSEAFVRGIVLPNATPVDALRRAVESQHQQEDVDLVIGLHLVLEDGANRATMVLLGDGAPQEKTYDHTGRAVNMAERSVSLTLDWVRRRLASG